MALHVDLFLELRSGGYRSTYNFGEKSTDDVGIALALLRLRQDGQLCSLFGISSLFLSLS